MRSLQQQGLTIKFWWATKCLLQSSCSFCYDTRALLEERLCDRLPMPQWMALYLCIFWLCCANFSSCCQWCLEASGRKEWGLSMSFMDVSRRSSHSYLWGWEWDLGPLCMLGRYSITQPSSFQWLNQRLEVFQVYCFNKINPAVIFFRTFLSLLHCPFGIMLAWYFPFSTLSFVFRVNKVCHFLQKDWSVSI